MQSATSVFFDAIFKVVPRIYYQLFTIVPHADYAFPALYALTSRKTQSLYVAVFEKVNQLVPSFTPLYPMADFVLPMFYIYINELLIKCVVTVVERGH